MKVANGIKTSISFSYLLESWVKAEAQKIQLPLDFVIADLSNRLGAGSNILELNDTILRTKLVNNSAVGTKVWESRMRFNRSRIQV